jgi:hypothetical protein
VKKKDYDLNPEELGIPIKDDELIPIFNYSI